MKRYLSLIVPVLAVGLLAHAGEVAERMEQLKENVANSGANYTQYKKNLDISTQNVIEATNAVKDLREQRKQLLTNGRDIENNQGTLDKMKAQLEKYKQDEEKMMKEEQKQIAEVEALLKRLQENVKQRKTNVAAYDTKIQEIEKEKAEWGKQGQALAELQNTLKEKEKEALSEREKWLEKKKAYRSEAIKWHKQNTVAEQTYTKFQRLQD